MAWLESHQELGDHPKTKRAARLLGVSLPTMVGHLHYLWWWALDYAQDGDLTGYDAAEIADAARWEGDPIPFLAALIDAGRGDDPGFVEADGDFGQRIHDWADFGGKTITRRKANAEKQQRHRDKERAASPRNRHVPGDIPTDSTVSSGDTSPGSNSVNRTGQDRTDTGQSTESPSSPDGDGHPPAPVAVASNGHGQAHAPPWPDVTWMRDTFNQAIWPPYPRKTHKAEAEKAFIARMKRHPTFEAAYEDAQGMVEAIVEQAQYWTEPAYTPHPATYIRGERDKDEIIVPTGAAGRRGRR